jgi:hypothetical protein
MHKVARILNKNAVDVNAKARIGDCADCGPDICSQRDF